jgi:hypothetical protein
LQSNVAVSVGPIKLVAQISRFFSRFPPNLVSVRQCLLSAFTDKPLEIGKQEWLEKLENVHLPRTNINRLVMNYLVTGKIIFF